MESLLKFPLEELIFKANKLRQEFMGQELELCSIVNAKSGLCGQDCKFCAQSTKHKTDVASYPLVSKEKIVAAAKEAKKIGAEKFGIVTSGNRLDKEELEEIILAVEKIVKDIGISVCGSLGALNKDDLKRLKQAGMSRYHHNIETSENFYPQIVSTHNFKERVSTIIAAKEVGFQVCSGGIIGMGESWQDRIDMANTLKELKVDSVPVNILVPIKGTPLEDLEPISFDDVIRTICIFRIILKDKIIKIAAGREAALGNSQQVGFAAGANGMLIGGYLTIKGRSIKADQELIKQIKKIWNQ